MTTEEIQAIFFAECEESLAAAEAGLAACKAGTQDADTVNAVFRGVHSIKGGAGAFGYVALQAFTHTFETLLSDVREETVPLTDTLIDLLLRALDTLSDHVTAARGMGDVPDDVALLAELTAAQAANASAAAPAPAAEPVAVTEPAPVASSFDSDDSGDPFDLDAMLDDIAGAMAPTTSEEAAEEPSPAAPAWLLKVRPHDGAMRNGGEPLLLLRELAGLGARCVECDCGPVPPLDALHPGTRSLGGTFAPDAHVSAPPTPDTFRFLVEEFSLACAPSATTHAGPPHPANTAPHCSTAHADPG